MRTGALAVVLALGLAGGVAPRADAGPDGFSYLEQHDVGRLRDAGEKAWREALEAADRMSERFRAMSRDMARLMSKASEEFAREMAPTLRDLADRLDEIARQLERRDRPDTI